MRLYPLQKIFIQATVFFFIVLWCYTAVMKLYDLHSFRATLQASPLTKSSYLILSIAVPVTELMIAGLLFFPSTVLKGLLASTMLMALFTGYVAIILGFYSERPCSCGGVISTMTWSQHLLLNVLLLVLAGMASWLYSHQQFFIMIDNRRSRKPAEKSRQPSRI